jgi:hypothetical protein
MRIQIENPDGDTLMAFIVDGEVNILAYFNCEIADIDENVMRIQMIEPIC